MQLFVVCGSPIIHHCSKNIYMKKTVLFLGNLCLFYFSSVWAQEKYFIFTFDSTVAVSDSQNAGTYYDVTNKWYPDRYPPHAFEQYTFNGSNVLRESISVVDDLVNRMPPSSRNGFHNWQGRKFDLAKANGDSTALVADLYIPSSWQSSHRIAMLWSTCFSNTDSMNGSFFNIFGFRNSTGSNPGFFVFNGYVGGYDSMNYPITYDTWYSLKINLTVSTFQYFINETLVRTDSDVNGTNYFGNIMLQAYNFGDSTLAANMQAFESYDVYWDNAGVINTKDIPLPVELSSFTAIASNSSAALSWKTATEKNNYGFEIERKLVGSHSSTSAQSDSWSKLGFVAGNGTSNTEHIYSYTDNTALSGTYMYRLKQIDNDGTYKYSSETEVTISIPKVFALNQNYPNPFNPTTTLTFTLAQDGFTTLKIYDILGKKVAALVNGEMKAGVQNTVTFDASKLSSGVYFSRLDNNGNAQIKKLLLMK
jgi:Secretion system C-terminal sorting domain